MAPLVSILKERQGFDTRVCVTGQHRAMLDQVLELFGIRPDFDLDIMQPGQTLSSITAKIITKLEGVYDEFKPDIILVHGDTATTLAASLSGFYNKIVIGHVEAGLRTGDIMSPWPEEANRKLTSCLANFNFAPTNTARDNLLAEGVNPNSIFVTGNTVIDALFSVKEKIDFQTDLRNGLEQKYVFAKATKPFILITGHRRESFGEGFRQICSAIRELSLSNPEFNFVYPVHLNPNVRTPVNLLLRDLDNVILLEPLDYVPFVYLMSRSYLVLTDSGGIQEEAPSFGKPVLVMRENTERPEGVNGGTVKLVGTNKEKIVSETLKLINNKEAYAKMASAINPYGDGNSCERIIKALEKEYGL